MPKKIISVIFFGNLFFLFNVFPIAKTIPNFGVPDVWAETMDQNSTLSDDQSPPAKDDSLKQENSEVSAPSPEAKAKEEPLSPKEIDNNLSPEPSTPVERKIIKAIEVEGNKTISLATILAKIKIRVGQDYLQNVISDDLKRLYNTGYFSDVSVDRKDYKGGFKVLIYLTEKPIVEKMTFSKIRHFNTRFIMNKMKTKEGKFLDKKILKDDEKTIEDLYSKKGLTMVKVDVESFVDEVTNKATLHFVIQEGRRVQIKRVNILGNRAFPDRKVMHAIKTRPRWLFNSGFLKEDVVKEDMDRIKAFYEQQGFIDVKSSYTIEPIGQGYLIVNINVDEGKRYYVGEITLKGNRVLTTPDILSTMETIKVGNVFSREKLETDISSIRTKYFDKGYIFADIKDSTSMNSETGKVELRLDVFEGNLAYVDQVKIQGNTRTRDIVIRREVRLSPGDQFDGAKLRRTKERLKNLGYFEDVSYDIEDTDSPDRKNLVVQVKEAKTGSLSFGGGYSTIDQVVGFVEVEQKNFDFANWPTFTGGGQDLSLRAETGSLRQDTRLSFTEPWLFDYPISAGFDAYRTQRDRSTDIGYAYDERRTGGDFRFGKELSEYLSAGITYRLEQIRISNLADGVSADLAKEVGTNQVSSLDFALTRDSRDSSFNPTKGLFVGGDVAFAGGILGGDKDFWRLQNRASYDVPLPKGSVLELSVRTGFAQAYSNTDGVPIFERLFAGGAKSIRGYNERKVGPIDPVTNDPIGGESLLVANVEYTIPVMDFLKVATFFDVGNVWAKAKDFASDDLKSGAGFGLRVKTPIGPINLDYGYPLNNEPGEEKRSGKFYFSVSRGF